MSAKKITKITLRLPDETHQKLSEISEESGESINAEIVSRLNESLGIGVYEKLTEIEQICLSNQAKLDALLKRLDDK
jgi:predicted DNA-binding protein